MLSGLEVLRSIDQTLQQAQREAAAIDREIARLTERLVVLREDEAETYRRLARLRLDAVRGDGVVAALSAAEARAKALLAQRQQVLERFDGALEALGRQWTELDGARSAAAKTVEERAQAAAAAQQAARSALAQTEPYRQQRAAAEAALKTAHFAEQKTALAEQDRALKGKPYEDDPLFVYLWERGWGTPAYWAGPVTRWFDRWVARLCGFDTARANYALLQEIPRRLAEHAAGLRARADKAVADWRELERAALDQGDARQLQEGLRAAQAELEALEQRREALEARLAEARNERNRWAQGEDATTREALGVLESALRREDLRGLREAALGTPFDEDDAAVRRLEHLAQERARIEAAVATQKTIQAAQRRRLEQLAEVRREYRQKGYGSDAWDFGQDDLLSALLGEMLRGAISRDVFWDGLGHHRRPGPSVPGSLGGLAGPGATPREEERFGGGGFGTGGSF